MLGIGIKVNIQLIQQWLNHGHTGSLEPNFIKIGDTKTLGPDNDIFLQSQIFSVHVSV